eukprot:169589-Pyramimonas_sp.AAC.1
MCSRSGRRPTSTASRRRRAPRELAPRSGHACARWRPERFCPTVIRLHAPPRPVILDPLFHSARP